MNLLIIKSIIYSDKPPSEKEAMIKELLPDWNILQIESAVCQFYNIRPEDLMSKVKTSRIVKAKHIVRYLMHKSRPGTASSLSKLIATDRKSVYNSIKKVEGYLEVGDPICAEIEAIRAKLTA